MQPTPILFLTSEAAYRQAKIDALDLDRRRLIADARRMTPSNNASMTPWPTAGTS